MKNVLVIFGATGDLMDKKIAPALYGLYSQHELKIDEIVGFGRKDLSTDSFKDQLKDSIQSKMKVDDKKVSSFLENVTYFKGDFNDRESFHNLKNYIQTIDTDINKHFYLAVPANLFDVIINSLAIAELIDDKSKIMIEKPIGVDTKSAKLIESIFAKFFNQNQIYRIDHYLGKEMIQNILVFRMYNKLLQNLWSKEFIEKVEIRLNEVIGLENRGGFYDPLGALRDVGQNHLLEIVALLAMELPKDPLANDIVSKRESVLELLKIYNNDEMTENTFRGQYKGYTTIDEVLPASTTETYFKLRCFINHPDWEGVPFIIESGKRIKDLSKEIIIYFKDGNKLIFLMAPESKILLTFKAKKNCLSQEIEEIKLEAGYACRVNDTQYVSEYIQLIDNFIKGDRKYFVSKEEVLATWRFVDPIVNAWKNDIVPLYKYNPDTNEAQNAAAKIII